MSSRKHATAKPASPVHRELSDGLVDWREETLARMRALILEADPEMTEEWKWMGTPVWSHDGIICTGETYKDKVKLTFAKGASLKDPQRLFNSSLEGNVRRAIDVRERSLSQRSWVPLQAVWRVLRQDTALLPDAQ